MIRSLLTKFSKHFNGDIKFVEDDLIIPCRKKHITPIAKLIDIDYFKFKKSISVGCPKCGIWSCTLLYNKINVIPELSINLAYICGPSKKFVYRPINEYIDCVSISDYGSARDSYTNRVYIYDNLYSYKVAYELYIIDNIYTDKYNDIVEYVKSYFGKLLLQELDNIILEYLLYDIKQYIK